MDPRRAQLGFASAIERIRVRMSADTVGRPSRRRLFQADQSRKPCRCQAMTVSGFTGTSAVCHSAQTRASMTQSQRSVLACRTRCGPVRCSTSSWCRKARMSRWSAARERA
jgi:GH24 family phage-related lysozyme (muramidase)